MDVSDLGKVAMTFGGQYSAQTLYDKLTVVVGADGQTYVTTRPNVINVSPGVSSGWEGSWQILSQRGPKGVGISNIRKTATSGTEDTYTIYYTDNTTDSFIVTNGQGIQSIAKTGSSGNVDTYTITYGNNQTSTFTVTNGQGVPVGGTEGQVLTKRSDADYATEWATIRSGAYSEVANNLNTFTAGFVLDARQGKALDEKVNKRALLTAVLVDIPADGWLSATGGNGSYAQIVSCPQVSENSHVIVTPSVATRNEWARCNAYPDTNSLLNGTLVFVADTVPNIRLRANVLIFDTTVQSNEPPVIG
jgi:hypothetical protein